jgi:hypothetical protein
MTAWTSVGRGQNSAQTTTHQPRSDHMGKCIAIKTMPETISKYVLAELPITRLLLSLPVLLIRIRNPYEMEEKKSGSYF